MCFKIFSNKVVKFFPVSYSVISLALTLYSALTPGDISTSNLFLTLALVIGSSLFAPFIVIVLPSLSIKLISLVLTVIGFVVPSVPPKIYLPSKLVLSICPNSATFSLISSLIALNSPLPYAAFPAETINSLTLCIVFVAWLNAESVVSIQFIVSLIFELNCLLA
ncbi:hypothetical protein SDC9_187835 [bioreactor metagenome]|uniref:Uncharacterized protein n=1 Tax=bioreactor metagenome TaxID=1076179 RepID=A0A645HPY6_9ZZZZ